jgi:N-formylglutamate amidohydrolase
MLYDLTLPTAPRLPIVISVPHCGTAFPDDIVGKFLPAKIQDLDDTDWFVQQLYSFAPAMGITLISARYHRWVIDLNRQPDSTPLYQDGRVITGLVTTTDFLGNPLYQEGQEPDADEIQRRLAQYFVPYHAKIEEILADLQTEFPHVLLYDAHSIRQFVPSIRQDAFPDMIVGTNDETSAHPRMIETALACLRRGKYQVAHNNPFKGGYITRHFGQPTQNRHALQLERAKIHYMDDTERAYHPERATEMQDVLQNMFIQLAQVLGTL